MNDKTKMLCLIAFVLTASGCGSGNGNGEDTDLTDPLISSDGVISTNGATISGGVATPVASVSSLQMDEFVDNPLVTVIPTELNGSTSTGLSTSYIANPLSN